MQRLDIVLYVSCSHIVFYGFKHWSQFLGGVFTVVS